MDKIAHIEIPHQLPAKLHIYDSPDEVMQVACDDAERCGEEYPADYDEAVDRIRNDLNCLLEITSASDIEYVRTYVANRSHQHHRVATMIEELKEEFPE